MPKPPLPGEKKWGQGISAIVQTAAFRGSEERAITTAEQQPHIGQEPRCGQNGCENRHNAHFPASSGGLSDAIQTVCGQIYTGPPPLF